MVHTSIIFVLANLILFSNTEIITYNNNNMIVD